MGVRQGCGATLFVCLEVISSEVQNSLFICYVLHFFDHTEVSVTAVCFGELW